MASTNPPATAFVPKRPRIESPEELRNATSAVTLRLIMGILGLVLPVLCYGYTIGRQATLLPSISHYYYTPVHGEFIAILCGFGFVLWVYQGYDNWDKIATNIAAVFAFGVALFPADPSGLELPDLSKLFLDSDSTNGKIHDASATGLFLMFFFISAFLFTRRPPVPGTKPTWQEFWKELKRSYLFLFFPKDAPRDKREMENQFHRVFAWLILLAIIGCGWTAFVLQALPVWFGYLETVAIWSFAASWLIKNRSKGSSNVDVPPRGG